MPAVPTERVIIPIFPYQVIAVVVIPVAGLASWCRTLGIAGKDVPAMQSTKIVVLVAGGQRPLRAEWKNCTVKDGDILNFLSKV